MQMDEINILIGGQAGQGLNAVEGMLVKFLKKNKYYIYSSKEYMSRVRGGINTVTFKISSTRKCSLKRDIDIIFSISKGVVDWCYKEGRISNETILLGEEEYISSETALSNKKIPISLKNIVEELGDKRYLNTAVAGLISSLLNTDKNLITDVLQSVFYGKNEKVIDDNKKAFFEGFEIGRQLHSQIKLCDINPDDSVTDKLMMSGNDGVSLGAIYGGCNYLSFYPMSPATGMANFFIENAKTFRLVVEQFEDEIAVINSAIGAAFGGARSVVTTSGGGFDLMEEAVSLSGMAEIPIVIHLAQRPGPSTGLPTRTMQSDFNLALYAGHGEFPRIIYAPASIEEAFYLSSKAFNVAQKCQIPVFLLTDQYLIDTYYLLDESDLVGEKAEKYYVKADVDYKRYALTDNGISPFAIPGDGKGIVISNGNEHDEYGDTTEEEHYSMKMQEKRNQKLLEIERDAIKPKFSGSDKYEVLIYSWGSTYFLVKDALEIINDNRLAHIHYSQLYPINRESLKYFNHARFILGIEQNFNGQFGDFLKTKIYKPINRKILKYNGRPFYLEEIIEAIKIFLGETYGS
jgi:2-oxoglutarate ferredoxin oxidoreductase subunit alpha